MNRATRQDASSPIFESIQQAAAPEDLFGEDPRTCLEDLKRIYRRLVWDVHPDRNPQRITEAKEAFARLHHWYRLAQEKVGMGIFGMRFAFEIRSPRRTYQVGANRLTGDIADLFPAWDGTKLCYLKAARKPDHNRLLDGEKRALSQLDLALAADPLHAHFPRLVDSFSIQDEKGALRRTNVIQVETGTMTLAEIIAAHPQGLDPRDMAWIFNRLLAALATSHRAGIVHGAVTPSHLLVRPEDHNAILIDWCYSVEEGAPFPDAPLSDSLGLPPEMARHRPATTATDLYMSALCMVSLLGGDLSTQTMPPSVPPPIQAILRSCLIPAPYRRAQDAWRLFDDFGEVLERLYGASRFRPFPSTATKTERR